MQSDHTESLKAELRMILPQIEEMRNRKNARKNQVSEVLTELQNIKNEMCISDGFSSNGLEIDEADLSVKKLEDLQRDLQTLQKEKVYICFSFALQWNFDSVFYRLYIFTSDHYL